ncbi:MAG TPA: ABC transporter ATP-binding protein, partial [Paracoccaceae bacterium]|nr:ABC transporter ATP-binding protein [Paracoccaceae bacterium]
MAIAEARQGARVELDGLSKYYGDFVAAEAVSLDIQAGEFMTFLGPSGSGKSTTLMMIAGFTIPSAGDVRLDGASIISQPVHTRNVGMVFQNYALFPHLSVERNVAFPLEMRKVPRNEIAERVKRALELVRLDGFAERRPKQLSGGQQQRVALARAMVFEPPVLLLDEPLGALDAKLREEMKFELKQLHHKVGATILFVTHDQEEALTLSDRIAVFNGGRLAQVGSPDALYNAPENRFVADFIGETNLLEGKVDAIQDGSCRVSIEGAGAMTGNLRDGFEKPTKTASYTLRLENVLLGHEADGADNVFDGMIEEFLFVGNARKYLI